MNTTLLHCKLLSLINEILLTGSEVNVNGYCNHEYLKLNTESLKSSGISSYRLGKENIGKVIEYKTENDKTFIVLETNKSAEENIKNRSSELYDYLQTLKIGTHTYKNKEYITYNIK